MAPIFDREEALASPYPPLGPIGALALEFAVLGQIDLARDLVSVLFREYPMHGPTAGLRELNLAWQATGKWPDDYPKDESAEGREEFARELEADLWPDEISEEDCTDDEAGLKTVLEVVDAIEAEGDDEDEDAQIEFTKSACLAKALSISIKLAEEKAGKTPSDQLDDRSQDILRQISERLHCSNQTESVASVARAWPYLARGLMAEAAGTNSEKLESLGKTIRDTVTEWFAQGPRPWKASEKSVKELLDICSDKSREFWADEYDEPAPETLFAPSGASEKEITELEKRLEVTFPADYKEFLGLSNGFKQIITDGLFEDFEAPLHATPEISWRKTDELLNIVDEDEDMDDDEGEDDEAPALQASRPAKKIKLADGAEAVTKDTEDENEGDEEEDEDLEELEWLKDQFNSFKLELLPLPPAAHLGLAGESQGEWPEIEKVIEVGSSEGSYLWLLPPEEAKKARDSYLKVYDSTKQEHMKKAILWAMIAFVGSEEAFRNFDDWVFIGWASGQMHVWSSFRRYLQELADTCTKLEKVEDEEKAAKAETLAYSCR